MVPGSKEEMARRIFGRRAAMYTVSECHRDESVLSELVQLAQPQPHWHVLDVATGTGHTALALSPHVGHVIGVDLTVEMLREAFRSVEEHRHDNVEFLAADVHALPFEDNTFDLVTCRRAPHHFSDIKQALAEMKRVLRAGSLLLIDDRSVPEDDFIDATMNELDRLHDESHVRQYRPSEWRDMLQSIGFAVEFCTLYTRQRPLSSLTESVRAENTNEISRILDGLSPEQRVAFNMESRDGTLYLDHFYVMVGGRSWQS